ncbi:hypothetical protein IGK21_002333 [Enterococcus sp. DIV1421a]
MKISWNSLKGVIFAKLRLIFFDTMNELHKFIREMINFCTLILVCKEKRSVHLYSVLLKALARQGIKAL